MILTNPFLYQSCYTKRFNEYHKVFWQEFQKKGLSGGSNQDEERKKIRNSNSAISIDNCDGFEEGLGSPECKEIFLIVLRI